MVERPGQAAESAWRIQGYLAHQNTPPPSTLQQAYAYGPMVVLGGGAISYQPGAPVIYEKGSSRGYMVRVNARVVRNLYQGRKAPKGWCENRAGNVIVIL